MTHTLVPSDRVETASVYGRDDRLIGTIERLMLQKKSGVVAYAVVRCGGLIKGEVHHYPVPWDSLKYDVAQGVYNEPNVRRTSERPIRAGRRGVRLGRPLQGLLPPAVLDSVKQPEY